MKYSNKFEKDFNWYLKVRSIFNFDGVDGYINKKGKDIMLGKIKGLTMC